MEDLKPSVLEAGTDKRFLGTLQANEEYLDNLYDYVIKKATEAIDWYYEKRKPKRRSGLILRYGSILFVALAGILPVIATIYDSRISPGWSAVVVGLAALMIGIDKFGGFTTGWIRYVVAAQKLTQLLEEFRFSWKTSKIRPVDTQLTIDEMQALMKKCMEFLEKVQSVVTDETQKWVAEFQSALSEVESSVKATAEQTKAAVKTKEEGAVSVSLTNGSSCDNPWSLRLDGKLLSTHSGNSAALNNLKPGIFTLKITGTINKKSAEDEKPVIVEGGKIALVTMTLT
jgi:hypothetical protein